MPNIPRHPHLTLDEWIVTHGRAPDARPIPFTSEPDSGPDMRQSIAPEMLAQIVIKPVPDVVADPDEEPECPPLPRPLPEKAP